MDREEGAGFPLGVEAAAFLTKLYGATWTSTREGGRERERRWEGGRKKGREEGGRESSRRKGGIEKGGRSGEREGGKIILGGYIQHYL